MNIYDIAREAQVSPATVSRVLNGSNKVKAETQKKILKIIEDANYVPNMLARNLSVGESQNIAFLVPDIDNSFFSKVLHGISDRASAYDYNIFMFGTDEDPKREHKVLASLKAEMIKGLIIIPVMEDDGVTARMLAEFESQGVPVVLIDRESSLSFDGVFSEDMSGAYEAVKCLIDAGHTDIAIIRGPDTSRPGHQRYVGYVNALRDSGIELNERYVVDGNFREEDSYEAMRYLMELDNPPTAIFTSNNMTTLGCLKYMKEKGMRLTEDISMAGFDDIELLTYTDVRLTAVARPIYEMGCEAMALLQRRFVEDDSDEERLISRHNMVRTWLIKRGSENLKKFQRSSKDE